ncbi:MAG: hypothetical protein WCK23_02510 [Actinomycetes bacterium]
MLAHVRHNDGVIMLQSPNGTMTALVYPEYGGRIGSLIVGNQEIFTTDNSNDDPLSWGCYPMVPYAGRMRDAILRFAGEQFPLRKNMPPHSIHGTVFNQSWNVIENSSLEVVLEIDLGTEWPFAGTVQHHIQLTDTRLDMQLVVNAIDAMPIQVGWHPWFLKPRATSLRFGAMLQRDSVGITTTQKVPQPAIPVDDCFVNPEEPLTITIGNIQLTLSSDCSHWVMYDIPLNATCVEPQSGPPNGVNDLPLVLDPDTSFSKNFTIEVQQIT